MPARQRPLRILVAEDNALNQRILRLNLERWGHQVVLAGDGIVALERWKEGGFDLILMDSQMPRMSGLGVAAAIRQTEPSAKRTPIIVTTANALEAFRDECRAAGMDGFLTKPIKRDELLAEIARVMPDLFIAGETAPLEDFSPSLPEGKAATEANRSGSTDDDPHLRREMLRIVLEHDAPRLSAMLDKALADGNCIEIEQAAHAIKGLAGELEADECRETAATLEEAARASGLEGVAKHGERLRRAFAQLVEMLREEQLAGSPAG